ncbi:MAG TPA: radical SAM protein [Elusimicrobiota bacterium]|nr:radical SAM protein [Elusimicrobiota bacterium]
MSPRLSLIFKLLAEKVDAGVARLDGKKDGQPIRELHLELTHRCNLKCVMCHHWEMPFKDRESVKREMNLAQIRSFVEGSQRLKDVEIVVLTGGEPWLRTDIVDVAAFLSSHYPKASLGILSNFWNTEMVRRRLNELRARGVKNLWLGSSLDGLEEAHDEVRGQKGAFKGLMETARMMRAEFPEVHFSFSFTITPKNYRELWPAYELVSGMGLWFGAQMVVEHQKFEAPETFSWTDGQLSEIEGQIERILRHLADENLALERLMQGKDRESLWLWTRLLYWWYLGKYARKPERFFKDCLAGQRYAMLSPEGDVFFCPVNKHRTIGNVKEASFDGVWDSRKAESERGYVDSCQCDCWLNCIANPVLDRAMALGTGKAEGALR